MRSIDEQLFRNAAPDDTCATDAKFLGHGNAGAVRRCNARRTNAAGTGTDYKQVKIKSHISFLCAPDGDAGKDLPIENAVQSERPAC
jgi:hypothetical protein